MRLNAAWVKQNSVADAYLRQKGSPMTLSRAALIAACSVVALPAFAADLYEFDPGHTEVLVSWNHLGFSTQRAEFNAASGEIYLDEKDPAKSRVDVTIDATALDTGVAEFDGHMKSEGFFDVAKFPTITFKSTKVELAGDKTAKVYGELTVKGVTKPVVLDVTLNRIAQNPIYNRYAAGFSAKTVVKRSEFGLGAYAPAVSDEVTITIDTELFKK